MIKVSLPRTTATQQKRVLCGIYPATISFFAVVICVRIDDKQLLIPSAFVSLTVKKGKHNNNNVVQGGGGLGRKEATPND